MIIEYPPLPPPPDITPFLADMQALVEEARAAAARETPPPPPPPPPVSPEELEAQIAELTRQAVAQLQALLASLRQAEAQLLTTPEEPPVTGGPDPLPSDEDGTDMEIKPPVGPPVTGGLDPLPAGEDDATGVAIPIPETLPVFVAVPGDKVLPPDGVGLARAAVMPVESASVGATELAVAAEQAVAAAQDDLVPVASPAAVTTWAQEPTAASAAASVASDSGEALAWAPMTHEFRVGAEGHAA